MVLINAVQPILNMGIQVISLRNVLVTQSRPFWIETGYVRKGYIMKTMKDILRMYVYAAYVGENRKKFKRVKNGKLGISRKEQLLVDK